MVYNSLYHLASCVKGASDSETKSLFWSRLLWTPFFNLVCQLQQKNLLFQLKLPGGGGHIAQMPEQGNCRPGFRQHIKYFHTACTTFLNLGKKTKYPLTRCSLSITPQALRVYKSLGFGRFLAFSPSVRKGNSVLPPFFYII